MKLKDILLYYNCIFAYDQINENMPENFKDFFLKAENQHNYNKNDNQLNNIWPKLSLVQSYFRVESDIKKN